jgi:phage N-6-adenine-methyltransferase
MTPASWLLKTKPQWVRPEQMSLVQSLSDHATKSSIHFSSATTEWSTPKWLFDYLTWIFGGFDLDPCATPENAKCAQFFTKADDGLSQSWCGGARGIKVFMNPPYGRQIGKWVKKAYLESLGGALVVCLLPARTDTAWWHDYVRRGYVHFVRRRLKFGGAKSSAPFPSAIVIFGKVFSSEIALVTSRDCHPAEG